MKNRIFTVFIAVSALILLSACTGAAPDATVKALDDIDGKTIGVLNAGAAVTYASALGTVREYASKEALAADLRAGAIDCAIVDDVITTQVIKAGRGLKALDEPLLSADFCVVTAKEARDLLADIDAALATLRENGTLDALKKHYLLGEAFEYAPRTDLQGNTGSLRLAAPTAFPPYSYSDGESFYGMDITLAQMVCDILGVRLVIVPTARESIEKTVWSANADFGMGGLYENGESLVVYSDGYVNCTLRVITRK